VKAWVPNGAINCPVDSVLTKEMEFDPGLAGLADLGAVVRAGSEAHLACDPHFQTPMNMRDAGYITLAPVAAWLFRITRLSTYLTQEGGR
jgi:hypothetical protein